MIPGRRNSHRSEKPASTKPPSNLAAAQHSVAFELPVVGIWVIERVMKAAAFFAGECGIHDQGGCGCEIAQLQQINRHFEIPIELADLALEISQSRARPL